MDLNPTFGELLETLSQHSDNRSAKSGNGGGASTIRSGASTKSGGGGNHSTGGVVLLVVAVRRRPRITTSTKRCGGSATGSRCRRTEETCGTEFQQRRYGACRPSRRSRFERAVRTGVLRPLPNDNNNVRPRQQRIRRSQTRRRRHSNRNDQLHRRSRGMTNRITTAEHGTAKWPRRVTRITESTTIRIQQQQKQRRKQQCRHNIHERGL